MTVFAASIDDEFVIDLTDNQRAIWFDQVARGQSPVYNIGGRLAIYGPVNHALLQQALTLLVTQNPVLRFRFLNNDGTLQQVARDFVSVDLPFLDFSLEPDPAQVADDWLHVQFETAFPMGEQSLFWQFALLRVSEQHHILLTKYHHLIADGWSTKIVIDRLAELYNASLQGGNPLPAESATFADYVRQEIEYLQSQQFSRDASFWQAQLPSLPQPLFKSKYAGSAALQTHRACHYRLELDRGFYNNLQNWADTQKIGVYQVLLAALTIYFARTQQQQRIVTGLPVLNRGGARFKKVIGMFASLSPLAIDIDTSVSVSAFLRQMGLAVRQVYKHQRYPLGVIHQRLQLLKHRRERVFDWVLSFERQEYNVQFGEAKVEARQLFNGFALYPLAVTVCEFGANSAVEVIFEGDETCFNSSELAWLAKRLIWILQQFIAVPDCLIGEIDLVPDEEKAFIFDRFNSPEPVPPFNSVVSQFKYWAGKTPDATAVSQSSSRLSYRQLDNASDRLAYYLQQQCDVAVGNLVALCMPRCIETIVGLLAILKLRAVYVPLDADSPFERLQRVVHKSRVSALLTLASQTHLQGLHENQLCIDALDACEVPDSVHFTDQQSDDLAYVIFTSGSSGEPKGVMIDCMALSARLIWLQNTFQCGPGMRVGQTIQTHFDPSLIEIFVALTQGAHLVLSEAMRLPAQAFAEFVMREKINVLALVPSSLRLLLQGLPKDGPYPLLVACCGGEVLPAELANEFIARTGARLFNVYGPTETTILASFWCCGADSKGVLPVGRPLPHGQILVVDKDLKLLPLGVSGEIVIGGLGVGKGYWLQDELTALAFRPNPYSIQVDSPLYRSGDYGYIGTDAQLYFDERLDRQVKISGYRIELAEIEQVLLQHPYVSGAAVKLMSHQGAKSIVAYLETNIADEQAFKTEVTAYLRRRLPEYMQPKALLIVREMPLTACGKIDYAALPNLEMPPVKPAVRAPVSGLEVQLLAIWRKTLQNPDLNVEDNFFAQDTDSLTAVSLLLALETLTGCRQSIAFLMAYPSVAEQAAYLEQSSCEAPSSAAMLLPHSLTHSMSERKAMRLSQSAASAQADSAVSLQKNSNSSRLPFYLAASGYGDQMRFQVLAEALAECCDLHVLYPPESDNSHKSIEQIAAAYAEIIRQRNAFPYFIAGFSIGGITAMETARQLEQQGLPPQGLILLDTVYPYWPLQSTWLLNVLQRFSSLWVFNRISMNGRELQAMLSDPGITSQLAALNRHTIRPFNGPVMLVMTQKMRWLQGLLFTRWRQLLGNSMVVEHMPGLHGAMFRSPYLATLVEIIQRGLNRM